VDHVRDNIGKPYARTSEWALFCGIWTCGVKVIKFESFYELKNEKITFTFILAMAMAQGTSVVLYGRSFVKIL